MKTLLSALALTAALSSAAQAGASAPVAGAARTGLMVLTEAQLDTITAGGGGMGVDPSDYDGGMDPSVYGTKGSTSAGGDSND